MLFSLSDAKMEVLVKTWDPWYFFMSQDFKVI